MIEYAPLIDDVIPGFISNKVKIPFAMNPAVSIAEVQGFKLQVRDYTNNDILAEATNSATPTNGYCEFTIQNWIPIVGQYYKFQIAYSDGSIDNVFSNVSIGKCIGDNESEDFLIQLNDLNPLDATNNYNLINYTGQYETIRLNEPLYSYKYNLTYIKKDPYTQNEETITLINSDDILYNVIENDKIENNKRISTFNFTLTNIEFETNVEYILTIYGTTINGYTISKTYKIKEPDVSWEEDENKKMTISLSQDDIAKENGYMTLLIESAIGGQNQEYILERRENTEQYFTIKNFKFDTNGPFKIEWKDYTIQQGCVYVYSIRKKTTYNDQPCWTNPKYSNSLLVDFEHMFLSDADRQLKIKFDPKVSSFKDTILDSKTDTIGSRYPFFFKNAQIKYKEIPISGLISYWMDNEQFFLKKEKIGLEIDYTDQLPIDADKLKNDVINGYNTYIKNNIEFSDEEKNTIKNIINTNTKINTVIYNEQQVIRVILDWKDEDILRICWTSFFESLLEKYIELYRPSTTNLTDYNMAAERKFKLEVLDWLNNGQPKLFRSPAEGNYIVRLMNTSLSPNDTLGRLLHSFSTTAYECMDNQVINLVNIGMLDFSEKEIVDLPLANLGSFTLGYSKLGWSINGSSGEVSI